MDQATKDAFSGMTKTMERGFTAIAEDISEIKSTMATKEDLATVKSELKSDIAGLGEQIASIERELKSIRRDLNDVMAKVENITGYRKEIDHALERIATIEKHLGIGRKMAA